MNAPRRYQKKPIEIEAAKFEGTDPELLGIYTWIEKNTLGSFEPLSRIEGEKPWPASGVAIDPASGRMIIATLEGGMHVEPGDYVIRGIEGEFYPCKPAIFEATYEEVEDQ